MITTLAPAAANLPTEDTADADTLTQYARLLGLTSDQVAPDAWARSTTFNEAGPHILHGRELEPVAGFTTYLSRLVIDGDPGVAEVVVRWGEDCGAEEFSLDVDSIPHLIEALTVAHGIVNESPTTLFRSPDVTAELMSRDA
ncbi:hypothetical protein QE375_001923 [Microbacterium foliorum]|uniref:Uncharacterized protein n=1 Tax=Microbacterium foliorum TaxID=104336 RepID=A0ABU1HSV3_9MICO|nr:hypothetical protein [Microbacterium foliorum]MDR6142369.1 hypothetical protein [Microbacterium foliorum]